MINWVSLIINLLKLTQSFVDWRRSSQSITAGEDKAIANAALKVLEATQYGKDLRNKVRQLSDDEADKLWDDITNV